MFDIYALCQQLLFFVLMFCNFGIVGYYLKEYFDCVNKFYLYVRDDFGVTFRIKMCVLLYIFGKLSLINFELYVKIKDERRLSVKLSMDNQLVDTDLGFVEYLEAKADELAVRARKLSCDKI